MYFLHFLFSRYTYTYTLCIYNMYTYEVCVCAGVCLMNVHRHRKAQHIYQLWRALTVPSSLRAASRTLGSSVACCTRRRPDRTYSPDETLRDSRVTDFVPVERINLGLFIFFFRAFERLSLRRRCNVQRFCQIKCKTILHQPSCQSSVDSEIKNKKNSFGSVEVECYGFFSFQN